MKITKKEIRELLKDSRESHGLGWTLNKCGFYVKDGEINRFIEWNGGGTPEIIYNGNYDDIVYLTDYCDKSMYTLKEATDGAYEEVLKMINEQPFEEVRELNISFTKGGSGSTTNRLTLPSVWVEKLGVTEDNKSVIVEFDGEEIRVRKNES